MGAKNKRRAHFLAANPFCCFCGSAAVATTVDHIPSRSCFIGRQWPDGFEFPACADCNTRTRLSEQVFSFYVRLLGPEPSRIEEIAAMLAGIQNNAPECLPTTGLSANKKRAVMRHWGTQLARGETYSEQGLISLPKAVEIHFTRSTQKLAKALYFKETRRPVCEDHCIFTNWSQYQIPSSQEALRSIQDVMPAYRLGERTNTNLGNQFAYWWGWNQEEDVFGVFVLFGDSLCVLAGIAPTALTKDIPDGGWVPIQAT